MKLTKKTAAIISLLAACVLFVAAVFAAGTDQSTNDPLVAKSYLDQQMSAMQAKIDALQNKLTSLESNQKDASTFTVVTMTKGQTLYASGSSGSSVELIVRRGDAKVVSPFKTGETKQGVADVTKGIEIFDAEAITLNDLILIPRGGDGRGITVTSDIAYVMVRGSYEIK